MSHSIKHVWAARNNKPHAILSIFDDEPTLNQHGAFLVIGRRGWPSYGRVANEAITPMDFIKPGDKARVTISVTLREAGQ